MILEILYFIDTGSDTWVGINLVEIVLDKNKNINANKTKE
jgi:hypothetical protein